MIGEKLNLVCKPERKSLVSCCMPVAMAKIVSGAAGRKIPWASEPGSECDRRAAKQPGRESEQSLGPHGRARIVKAGRGSASAEVIAVQQQVFVGIDVSKRQLEVALNTGEGFGAELVRRLRTAAPEVVVLEASDYVGYVLDRRHVRIGLKNLELAFACRSEKERRQILRASYVNLGRDAAEYIRLGGRRGRCRWGRRRYFRSSYLGRTNHSLSCP